MHWHLSNPSQHCFVSSFGSRFSVFHHAWSTCRATKTFVAGWKNIVAKRRARVYFEQQSLALLFVFHQTHNLSRNKFAHVAREGFCISYFAAFNVACVVGGISLASAFVLVGKPWTRIPPATQCTFNGTKHKQALLRNQSWWKHALFTTDSTAIKASGKKNPFWQVFKIHVTTLEAESESYTFVNREIIFRFYRSRAFAIHRTFNHLSSLGLFGPLHCFSSLLWGWNQC